MNAKKGTVKIRAMGEHGAYFEFDDMELRSLDINPINETFEFNPSLKNIVVTATWIQVIPQYNFIQSLWIKISRKIDKIMKINLLDKF